ncbi:MAG: hypothetical protein JWO06_3407, partial [Bacteroidota bacterium]|nr:hypothetical protein [Bacteroidota bacterium]
KAPSERTDLDSLIIAYVHCPLNSAGFRSPEFLETVNSAPKVLLLGDSYTYGHSTKNKTYSFADLLMTKKYAVYNTGLSAADPPQYLSVARKYIPLIKPQYVVVNICMANDVDYYEKKYRPYQPYYYVTNAGCLDACPRGLNMANANESYQLIRSLIYIPQTSCLNRLCSKTCLATLVWTAFRKIKFGSVTPPLLICNWIPYPSFIKGISLLQMTG